MSCPQSGPVQLDAVVAKTLDATTKIEGTWFEIYGQLGEGAHDWIRKEILQFGLTRHISWRSVEL